MASSEDMAARIDALRADMATRGRYFRATKLDVHLLLGEIDRLTELVARLEGNGNTVLERRAFANGYSRAAADGRECLTDHRGTISADEMVGLLERGGELRRATADNPEFVWTTDPERRKRNDE